MYRYMNVLICCDLHVRMDSACKGAGATYHDNITDVTCRGEHLCAKLAILESHGVSLSAIFRSALNCRVD
jgi:hypothetical protein